MVAAVRQRTLTHVCKQREENEGLTVLSLFQRWRSCKLLLLLLLLLQLMLPWAFPHRLMAPNSSVSYRGVNPAGSPPEGQVTHAKGPAATAASIIQLQKN